jgi:hypothetical protein
MRLHHIFGHQKHDGNWDNMRLSSDWSFKNNEYGFLIMKQLTFS